MKFHPKSPFILLTASADHSIRLSNVDTAACIAYFAGLFHESQVICIDFDFDGNHFVSGGMDKQICIWTLDSKIKNQMKKSQDHEMGRTFKTKRIYYPDFITEQVHNNYIDSICWMSKNSFLSRSSDGDVVHWKVGSADDTDLNLKATRIFKLHNIRGMSSASVNVWFLRMQLDNNRRYLALGTERGQIQFWDLQADKTNAIEQSRLSKTMTSTLIGTVSFSPDDLILVAGTDDGKIIRFDKKEKCLP